jgi:hypothetical protein
MARIITPVINQDIDYKFSRIHEPFIIELETLCDLGIQSCVEVPTGFVHDYESVPLFKGTSKTGGIVHDYLCRSDSMPLVTKKIAADCYFEVMETSDKWKATGNLQLIQYWLRRWAKYSVVLVAPGYFHRHKVMATYEEMSGEKELSAA